MALQVWLPLLEDAHNQGLMDIEPTVMGTEITYTQGKLGNSATFPCSAASCIHFPGLKQQGSFSWACWFKCTGNGASTYNQYILSEGRDTGSIGVNIYLNNAGTSLVAKDGQSTQTVAVSLNEWHHVAFVFDGTNKHLYVDGVFIASTVAKSEHDYAQSNDRFVIGKMAYSYALTGSYFPFNGQICDVRIYDHALSLKEVKDISKGLIVHYPLNDKIGCPNLLPHSRASAENFTLVGLSTSTSSFVTEDGRECYKCGTGNTTPSTVYMNWQQKVLLDANTTYTYSALIKSNKTDWFNFTKLGHFQAYNSASTASDPTHEDIVSKRIYHPSRIVAGEWTKISITFTTNDLDNSIFRAFPIYNLGSDTVVYICDQKLEKGVYATPWVPNIEDDDYVSLGLYENKVHDCSGYLRDGTVIDASNLFSDEPTTYNPSVYNAYRIPISETLVAGQTYTIQLWDVDVQHTGKSAADLGVDFYLGGGSLRMYWWHASSFTNGHADYLKGSFTVTEDQASHADGGNLFFNVYNSVGYVAGNMYMHIGRWRMEKGAVATDGPIEITGDTPRYSVCPRFASGTHYRFTDLPTLTEYTLSFWASYKTGAMAFGYNNGNRFNLYSAGNVFLCNTGDGTQNPYLDSAGNNVSATPYYYHPHHYAIVSDGTKVELYVDAKHIGTAKTYKPITGTELILNGWAISEAYLLYNSISDFRIYATALSDEDIRELYEVSASVDQNGNTWAYEFTEV